MRFLITGAAGFIGHGLALRLLQQGHEVVGVDSLNAYYDPALKHARLARLVPFADFRFVQVDIAEPEALAALHPSGPFDVVVHLAAQAGVRHSIDAPFEYARANLLGHLSVLEFCRHAAGSSLLVYASSSSVYGSQLQAPFKESDPIDRPDSLYAATKCADELMSSSYAGLYGLRQIGVRFFTVYGPWGRPDMAYWLFAERILRGEPIRVFNNGTLLRDFTYIDDALDGLQALVLGEPRFPDSRPHRIYNIGNNRPVPLHDFIAAIERAAGRAALQVMEPMQPGDVPMTRADISAIAEDYGFRPQVRLDQGIADFVTWLRSWQSRGQDRTLV